MEKAWKRLQAEYISCCESLAMVGEELLNYILDDLMPWHYDYGSK